MGFGTRTIPGKMPVVKEHIAKFGQHLFGVFPTVFDDDKRAFMYTIGNADLGLPELLLVGQFDPEVCGIVLNMLGERMRAQGAALIEGDHDIGADAMPRIRRVTDIDAVRNEWTIQVGQHLGRQDYDVLQVMFCDIKGRYPGDEGVAPVFDVPIL